MTKITYSKKLIIKSVAIIIFLMATFLSEKAYSQNAKSLFNKHHKWGIVGQYNIFNGADISPINNNNLIFEIPNSKRFAVGLAYNFYQYKNWNFKAELQLQWFGDEEIITIGEEENISMFTLGIGSHTEGDRIGYLPLTAEYIFLNNKRVNFSLGGGLGVTYFENVMSGGTFSVNDVLLFETIVENNSSPIYFSAHLSASVFLKFKLFMLQTSVIYKKSFTDFRTGTFEFQNLELSPNTSGTIEQSGDFLGIGFTIYPKKRVKK